MAHYPTTWKELQTRNAHYAESHTPHPKFTPEELAKPKLLIVSCIDFRVVPEQIFQAQGEIPVLRNAGGRIKNSIIDAVTLDTIVNVHEIVIMHHTDCGLVHVNNEHCRRQLLERDPGNKEIEEYDFGCFTDPYETIKEDVAYLRKNPLVRKETRITGVVYDLSSGITHEVVVA